LTFGLLPLARTETVALPQNQALPIALLFLFLIRIQSRTAKSKGPLFPVLVLICSKTEYKLQPTEKLACDLRLVIFI
jgi:hypothetical protein